MTEITPETLSNRLEEDSEDLIVLDIRHESAYEEWHIPGSQNIDVYDELDSDPHAAAAALSSLPTDREVVTVCAVGHRSQQATDLLRERGYDAKTLVDGMQGWARVHRSAPLPTTDAEIVQVARPGTGCLSYVIRSEGEALVVDPSQYTQVYEKLLTQEGTALTGVLETHAHADHVSGAAALAATYDVPYYLHPDDAGDRSDTTALTDGQEVTVGSTNLTILHTPGHTDGSVTVDVGGDVLLTGDTLFLESVGRPDLDDERQGAVEQRARTLHHSLQRILTQTDGDRVLPAHMTGTPSPPVSAPLGEIRQHNELLEAPADEFVSQVTQDMPEKPANHDRIKKANLDQLTLDESDARQLEVGPNQCAAN